jgi:hypothetical protein
MNLKSKDGSTKLPEVLKTIARDVGASDSPIQHGKK